MSLPMWCNLCNRNIVPGKKFNWLVFILLCGLFYLPVYWLQKNKCPICGGVNFGPARAADIAKPQA